MNTMISIEHLVERLRATLGSDVSNTDTLMLGDELNDLHPSDLAQVLDQLTLQQALIVFGYIREDIAAETLDELDPETQRYLAEHLSSERIVKILDILPMDDAAELVSEIDEREADLFIARLPAEDALEVQELLAYPENTAGRLMTRKYASVSPYITVRETMQYLRESSEELETINVVYVVNGGGRLAGVVSIRDIIIADAEECMKAIMTTEVITVSPEADQQLVRFAAVMSLRP